MSHFSQMAGLTVQNFLSAATGMRVAVALVARLRRRRCATLGNFWVDLVRGTLYVLLPSSILCALASSGRACRRRSRLVDATTLEGAKQTIALGPVASQIAIKHARHQRRRLLQRQRGASLREPDALSNLCRCSSIFVIPRADLHVFGRWSATAPGLGASRRHGRPVPGRRRRLYWAEARQSAIRPRAASIRRRQHGGQGGPLRHRRSRRSSPRSPPAASCGAVNACTTASRRSAAWCRCQHPARRVSPGGVGAGLYGMLVFAMLAVFIAGLMVGRTPEYLGKKIEAREMKLAMLASSVLPLAILGFTAARRRAAGVGLEGLGSTPARTAVRDPLRLHVGGRQQRLGLRRPHGQHAWYNTTQGIAMLLGRFAYHRPGAGHRRLAGRQEAGAAPSAGTFPTHGPLFVGLLVGVILIVGGSVLPGARARPDRRAFRDARRHRPSVQRGVHAQGQNRSRSLGGLLFFDPAIVKPAACGARAQARSAQAGRNPVMFVVEVGAVLTTDPVRARPRRHRRRRRFAGQIALWLWFTVLFANFAEAWPRAAARRRPTACADPQPTHRPSSLRRRRLDRPRPSPRRARRSATSCWSRPASDPRRRRGRRGHRLRRRVGHHRRVRAGHPRSGGDRSAVTGGTRVLSDRIKVRITAKPGETFLDRMIALVEGAERQKTPNEIALTSCSPA
jgi:K+-transporting ATPase ATPase A chain